MNIYAIEGQKVRCSTFDAGYDYDREKSKKYLEIGKEYTVDYTIVDSFETTVYLKEVPTIGFNSVFFEDGFEQSDGNDMEHNDWQRYNK